MTPERAIEILDPEHREHYDNLEVVNEACRMGMEALKIIYPLADKSFDYKPTNAEVLIQMLADVVQNGANEDGFSNVEYEEIVYLTEQLSCPYIRQPRCAHTGDGAENPDAYRDCDACKDHWLNEKWGE